MVSAKQKSLRGVCCFHSETGTEGGYWAFQDSQFITKDVPRPYCKKCGKYLKPQKSGGIKITKVLRTTQDILDSKEPRECPEGQHESETDDSWSYEGLHILKDGDHLVIYSKNNPSKIVWSGIIQLCRYAVFTEHAFGFWIHADQGGVDRNLWAKWFLEEYTAKLILS